MNWEILDIPTHPVRDGHWVRAVAHIRKNSTGEIRRFVTEEVLENQQPFPRTYNWREGNFSCDCNRELFFLRANGDEEPEHLECDEGHYSVNLENPVTGEIYYREYTESHPDS